MVFNLNWITLSFAYSEPKLIICKWKAPDEWSNDVPWRPTLFETLFQMKKLTEILRCDWYENHSLPQQNVDIVHAKQYTTSPPVRQEKNYFLKQTCTVCWETWVNNPAYISAVTFWDYYISNTSIQTSP